MRRDLQEVAEVVVEEEEEELEEVVEVVSYLSEKVSNEIWKLQLIHNSTIKFYI